MTQTSGTCCIKSSWRINACIYRSCMNGGRMILKVASISQCLAIPSNCSWRSVANTRCQRSSSGMSRRMKCSGTKPISNWKSKSFWSLCRRFSRLWFSIRVRFEGEGFKSPTKLYRIAHVGYDFVDNHGSRAKNSFVTWFPVAHITGQHLQWVGSEVSLNKLKIIRSNTLSMINFQKTVPLVTVALVIITMFSGCQSSPTKITGELGMLQGHWEGKGAGGDCSITISGDALEYHADEVWYKATIQWHNSAHVLS